MRQAILVDIQDDLKRSGTTPEEILGELAWPFVGLQSPVHHSFQTDEPPSGCDVVVQDLILHFANRENLKAWPESYHAEILTTLHYLHQTLSTVMKHTNLLFDCANLHQLKMGDSQSVEMQEDLVRWYRPNPSAARQL